MLLPEITQRLRDNHQAFVALLAGMHANELVHAPAGKWSAMQQLDHLRRLERPVRWAFMSLLWLLGVAGETQQAWPFV